MKVKLDFKELASVLGYVNTVINDKTVDEKLKNVIFLVKEDDVTVVGYTPITFSRTRLENVSTEGVTGDWSFQVKASELNKIISSYSNLFKTVVKEIEFVNKDSKVMLVVHEEAIEEKDSRLSQTGRFLLNNIAISDFIRKEISMEYPSDSDTVMTSDLLVYLDSLFPLMDTGASGKLYFGEEYVFVISQAVSTFFNNRLPSAFSGIALGYSSVNFLKRLCDGVEVVSVHKNNHYLCIQSGLTEAFMKYQGVKVNINMYTSNMNTDNGIVLDRLYLKDVLKRMLVSSTDGNVSLTDDGLEVSNEDFNQIIPINNMKGDLGGLKFKISVPLFVKIIVGDDSFFAEELFLYFVKKGPRNYIIYVKDKSDGWFSTIQVRV